MSSFAILILSLLTSIINSELQTHITTNTNSNKYVKVILVEDTRHPPTNNDRNGTWYLNCNPKPTFWGLKIELKSDLYGFRNNKNSIIEITINDVTRDRNVEADLFTAFAVNEKYFANFNNIDDKYGYSLPDGAGQYIYPQCLLNLAKNSDLETVFSGLSGRYSYEYERGLITTGTISDLYQVSNNTNTDGSSLTYKIINDAINDQVYFEFNSGTVNYQCIYNDSFDLYSDLYFYIQNDCDGVMEELWIHSFDITTRYICSFIIIIIYI